MTKVGIDIFKVGGTNIAQYTGASDFDSDGLDLTKFNSDWIIYLDSTHTTGTPTITVQCSDDNSNWFDYKSGSTLISIPETFIDNEFFPRWIRIVYVANSSNGNVSFSLAKV